VNIRPRYLRQTKAATHQTTFGGISGRLTVEGQNAVPAVDQNLLAISDIT
jgi:hypothetical protein